ncbi:Csu type fimbrial protein [Lysobacter fragariae]
MIRRQILSLLALLLSVLAPAAWAQSCTTAGQPLAFGVMGTPTAQRDTTANITVTCSGGAANGSLRVCLGISAGTGGVTPTNRLLVNGGNNVAYQITTTPGGANWGDNIGGRPGSEVTVPLNGSGSGSASTTMFGRIGGGQNVVATTYSSTLSVLGRIPSGGSPCVNGTGSALPTTTFLASANLTGTCTISAVPLNFGIAANLSSPIDASGGLTVTCSNTLAYSVALNAGTTTGNTIAARKLALGGAGAGVVSYQLYQDNPRTIVWGDGVAGGSAWVGTGSGTAQTLTVFGRVPAQATPAGGTYTDTVTATVTY